MLKIMTTDNFTLFGGVSTATMNAQTDVFGNYGILLQIFRKSETKTTSYQPWPFKTQTALQSRAAAR